MFNYTTCFVFWAVVAPVFFPLVPLWYRIGLVFAHIVPIFFSLVHYYLNDNTMYLSDWWHCAVVGAIYCTMNWMFTVSAGGEPVYPFLPWDSFMSVFWCTFCTFVGIGCYWLTVMLTNKCRNRPICSGRDDIKAQMRKELPSTQLIEMDGSSSDDAT